MKVAVSTDDGQVARHFGRCQQYTIAEISDGQVRETEIVENPGHEPGFLPGFLVDKGVDCVLTGGMGSRAQKLFSEKGIDAMSGVQGGVKQVLAKFAAGELSAGDDLCDR